MWHLAEECKEMYEYLMAKSLTDYVSYVELTNRDWIKGKHLAFVCSTVQSFLEGSIHTEIGNSRILVISMPPQFGKSMAVTETLPSWYLGKNPRSRTIILSYGEDLALRFGRRNKEKLAEYGQSLFGIELSKHKKSDASFEVSGYNGSVISRGIMAGITGNPADLILIDDPIKNREQADSDKYREKLWEEFNNSILTRLSSSGKIILIMTRWHEDDLAGRIIREQILPCTVINIPCEAEEDDILGREPGDPLFPELGRDKKWMEERKSAYLSGENTDAKEMGSGVRTWNALYQGRPTALEGNMIKKEWWKFYESVPSSFDSSVISIDCAFKGTEKSDYVVLQLWARFANDFYLIDQIRERLSFTETISAIRVFSQRYPWCKTILIEDKANGPAVIDSLKREIIGISAYEPKGSKESRVSAVSPVIESGHCYLPRFSPFTSLFIDECSSFPNGKNDDIVDSLTMALDRLYLMNSKFRKIDPPKGFWTPKELEEFNRRNNPVSSTIHRPGKVKGAKKNVKRFITHV